MNPTKWWVSLSEVPEPEDRFSILGLLFLFGITVWKIHRGKNSLWILLPLFLLAFFLLNRNRYRQFTRYLFFALHCFIRCFLLIGLVFVFYFVVTPVGIWKRRQAWDPLRLKKNSKVAFIQSDRLPERPFENQF